jgi:acetolactate synthase I/III small subunit
MNHPPLRTFVAYVEDQPGVLNRIASLFRRRNFNIVSLNVGRTHTAGVSRMTVVVEADDDKARRIEANLYKLVNVLSVEDITKAPNIVRDLALIKVHAPPEKRSEVLQLCQVFRARAVDVGPDTLVVEITGTQDKIVGLLTILEPFGVLEMVQSGTVAMTRGSISDAAKSIREPTGRGIAAA